MSGRRLFLLIGLLLTSVAVIPSQIACADEPKNREAERIKVVIDYGDGVEKHFTAIPWKKGMTVLAAMQEAQSHPRGIRFDHQGQGPTAFLTKIDDLANEGKERNWLYRVNGKLANEGLGTRELVAGDVVLWRFQ